MSASPQNFGWLLTQRLCQITHVGRKSGRTYHTVVEVVMHDSATGEVTVVSGYGQTADWYRNTLASGSAEIRTGRRHFRADVRELDTDEAMGVMADYEHRNRFIAPLINIGLTRLLGWKYDGSQSARQRLVAELPLVTFTPVDDAPPA
jgi:deazaflavin-dependent oxidoreductase (nitroreductase family)